MASNPPGACCATGFKHSGEPTGKIETIGKIRTYFAYPEGQKATKAIIISTDVFGIFVNSQLLADDFARQGYLAVIPDLFDGDQLPPDALETGKVDLPTWLGKHGIETSEPVVAETIKYVRETLKIERIAGVGYCYGAKPIIRLLKGGAFDVGYVAHPSFVTVEEVAAIKKPLSISAAEIDTIFTTQLRHDTEEILPKTGQAWQINLFGGVSHGFAVRGDLTKKHILYAKEKAFSQALFWFEAYL